jgi:hypothetical protein
VLPLPLASPASRLQNMRTRTFSWRRGRDTAEAWFEQLVSPELFLTKPISTDFLIIGGGIKASAWRVN